MKLKSFKYNVLAFAILSVICIGLVVSSTIKNNNIKHNSKIAANNKTDIEFNKRKEVKKQQLRDAAVKKEIQFKKEQNDLEKMWKIGYDQFFRKEYSQAIETERKVIKEDPNFYKAYSIEGISLAYNGDFIKGMVQIDKSLKLNPNYGYGRFNKALANELFGHYDEAIKWYKKAIEVEKFEWSYYGIASIYGRYGDVTNSIKYLKLAIDINPKVKDVAKNEVDFDNVRKSEEFKKLMISIVD